MNERHPYPWGMSLRTLKFWGNEVFPEGVWHEAEAGFVHYKALPGDLYLVFRRREDWELDLLEGGYEATHAAVRGIDVDSERPNIQALCDWLWAARVAYKARAGGPAVRSMTGPLSGHLVRYLDGTLPLDVCTDLTKLDPGDGGSLIISGTSDSGKSLLAYRIARDFMVSKGANVMVFTDHRPHTLRIFQEHWGVQPDVTQYRLESTQDMLRSLEGVRYDLIVVDVQVPGLTDHAQRLALGRGTRVVWTFEGQTNYRLNAAARRASASTLMLRSEGGGRPFLVTKNRNGPQNFRVIPGLA